MREHEHSDPNSLVYQHNYKIEHKKDFDNEKIVKRAKKDFKLQLKLNPS